MTSLIAMFILYYYDAGWGWWILFGLILTCELIERVK